jgi:hypothetical protein
MRLSYEWSTHGLHDTSGLRALCRTSRWLQVCQLKKTFSSSLLDITATHGAAHQHALHLWAQQVPLALQPCNGSCCQYQHLCDACPVYILCV